MAILVNDLRQIPSFSLLLWRFCGVFMLEQPATVPHYARLSEIAFPSSALNACHATETNTNFCNRLAPF